MGTLIKTKNYKTLVTKKLTTEVSSSYYYGYWDIGSDTVTAVDSSTITSKVFTGQSTYNDPDVRYIMMNILGSFYMSQFAQSIRYYSTIGSIQQYFYFSVGYETGVITENSTSISTYNTTELSNSALGSGDEFTLNRTITFTNTSGSEKKLNNIAFYIAGADTRSGTRKPCLLAVYMFDEITIPNNGSATITFDF